jgi:Laminin N-terminal (Domain VI)
MIDVKRKISNFTGLAGLRMMGDRHPISLLLIAALCCAWITQCEAARGELTPPYFNLAEGRKIVASSTCGVGIEGRELYCKLVGSHTDDQQNNTLLEFGEIMHSSSTKPGHVVIQGQVRRYSADQVKLFEI